MPLTVRRSLIDRVRQWRKLAYAVCAGLTILASAAVFVSISSPSAVIEPATDEPFFDAPRAFRAAEEMWERLVGQADMTEAEAESDLLDWFEDQLPSANMTAVETYKAPMGGESVELTNYTVVLEGVAPEVVVIAAPRDIPSGVRIQPLSYTSGTGVLLEMITVFSARPHSKTLVFLSTEDSATGGLGIDHFLQTSELADQVSAIISINSLGKVAAGTENAHELSVGVTSTRNMTPGWLLQLVSASFARSEVDLVVPGLWRQAAERTMALAEGDQIAGLTNGIPSIRLYDDSPGAPSSTGLRAHGPALERLVLSLDQGAELPGDPGTALLLESGRYLTNAAVTLLAILCLTPSLGALVIWMNASRPKFVTLLRHLRNVASFALPLALTMLMAYFLSLGGLIPVYRFQVPSEGEATQVGIGPLLILLIVLIGTFVVSRRFLGYFRPKESRPTTEMTKLSTAYLSIFFGLTLLTARSAFLMLACLSIAWAWPLATCFAEPIYRGVFIRRRLATNLPLFVAGFIMPLVFYGYVSSGRGVGWFSTGWFLLVQTMSGVYGFAAPLGLIFVFAGLAVLLGVKRMRVTPVESLDVGDEMSMLEIPTPRSRRRGRRKSEGGYQSPLSPWD